jgi:hypothetical protein
MKKFLAAASSLGMVLSMSFAVPMPAYAAPDGTVAFCKAVADFYPTVTVGDCVSISRSNEVPAFCKLLDEVGLLDFLGINRGNCVSYIRHL